MHLKCVGGVFAACFVRNQQKGLTAKVPGLRHRHLWAWPVPLHQNIAFSGLSFFSWRLSTPLVLLPSSCEHLCGVRAHLHCHLLLRDRRVIVHDWPDGKLQMPLHRQGAFPLDPFSTFYLSSPLLYPFTAIFLHPPPSIDPIYLLLASSSSFLLLPKLWKAPFLVLLFLLLTWLVSSFLWFRFLVVFV